jgi:beta-lactamase superfamily II metal-dependent hydrolase
MASFIRTFHSVGQGAFYTEKHILGNGKKFTVVYDCGSKAKTHLETRIASIFPEKYQIDILFISHFHDDHINGIDFLKKHCCIKRVVMPFVDDESKVLLKAISPASVWNLIDNPKGYFGDATPVTKVKTDPDSDNSQPVAVENMPPEILSGKRITTSDWFYIPFNYEDTIRKPQFIEELKNQGLNITDITEIENVKKYKNKIKTAYNNIGGDLNINSMALYSGKQQNDAITFMNPHLCTENLQSGCLYTGDIDLNQEGIVDDLKSKLNDFFSYTGAIQIPHHGSEKNFNVSILEKNINCAIISCGGKFKCYKHPSHKVIEDLVANSVCVHIVTECPQSTVIQTKK